MISPSPDRARGAKQRLAMYRTELAERAALLARLDYSQEYARARLIANLTWDFEIPGGSRPSELGDDEVARIVKASYGRR